MTVQADQIRDKRRHFAAPGGSHDRLIGFLAKALPAAIGLVAAVMILSLAAAMVISSKMGWKWRVALVSVAMVATAAIVPFTMQYAGLGEAKDAATIEAYVETRQGYNQEGGGGIDIAGMSLPMQLFTVRIALP